MSISYIYSRKGLIFPSLAFMSRHGQGIDRDKDSNVNDYIVYGKPSYKPQTPQKLGWLPKLVRIFVVILLIASFLAVSLEGFLSFTLLPRFPTQNYIGVTSDIKVAEVRAEPIKELPNDMNIYLTLLHNDGYQKSICNGCTKRGDQVILQGKLIKDSPWLGLLGWPLGFKLTRFEWHSQKSNFGSNTPNSITLDGGEDSLFTRMQGLGWLFVTATYSNPVVIPADGKTYNVFISQSGILYIQPEK